jgi:hypothetical protein
MQVIDYQIIMKKYLCYFIFFFLAENALSQNAAMPNFEDEWAFPKHKKAIKRNKVITANAIAFGTLYLFGGVAFDTRFTKNQTHGLGCTIGIDNIINQYFTFHDDGCDDLSSFRFKKAMSVPLSLNYLFGAKKHHIELGAELFPMIKMGYESRQIAGDWITKKATKLNVYPFVNIGYRYQALQKGFVFSALLKPIYFEGSLGVAFSTGIGYGF